VSCTTSHSIGQAATGKAEIHCRVEANEYRATIAKKLATGLTLDCSRDLNPLGSDIDYNFFMKPYSVWVSGCRAGESKLDAFFKKLKTETKTKISFPLSNPLCPAPHRVESYAVIDKDSFNSVRCPV